MKRLFHSIDVMFVFTVIFLLGCASDSTTNGLDEFPRFAHQESSAVHRVKPHVISASPNRDSQAYENAESTLREADWKRLERLAPRHEWEQLILKKRRQLAEQDQSESDVPNQLRKTTQVRRSSPAHANRHINEFKQPDGRIRIQYRLQHYGGLGVTDTRQSLYDKPNVKKEADSLNLLVDVVKKHVGEGGEVQVLPSENLLLISCDPKYRESVLDLIEKIDSCRAQVQITVRIFEVSDDFDLQLGVRTLIKHLSSNNTQAFLGNFDAKSFAGQVIDPLNSLGPNPGAVLNLAGAFQSAGVHVDVTLQALEKSGLVKVVSAPRMTVCIGKSAFMMAGQELPIREGRIANDKFVTEQIRYRPIGVQLHITPQAAGHDSVKLHISTVVSAVSGFAPLPTINEHELNPRLINPLLDSRQAETTVEVPDGETLAFGGLRMVRRVAKQEKVPFLGDLPVVSPLFKNHRSQDQLTDLFFFVTPKLLRGVHESDEGDESSE